MASESLVFDPTSEDATNIQVSLEDQANGIAVLSQEYPAPERRRKTAASSDTFGDPFVQGAYGNRQIPLVIRCFGSEATMRARVASLTQKVGKFAQYGGTLKRTLNNGDAVIFDVLDADIEVPADWQFLHSNNVSVPITLTAKPAARGPEESFSSVSETTLPALIWTMTGVKGDVPGLVRWVFDEQDGDDQQFLHFGLQCRNYPGAAAGTTTAHLFYEAEALTPLGGAAGSALAGASGGTVVNQGTVTTSYQAMLGLKLASGTFLTHVGDFSVWARVYQPTGNAGTVTCALEWAQGDFRNVTRNTEQELPATDRGQLLMVPLGQVHLSKAAAGAQRWEGRVIAKSTTLGDDFAVDEIELFPVTEGYGEISATSVISAPAAFSARDEFDQSAGNLTGKSAPTGGAWAGAGDADDFAVETSFARARRTATGDAQSDTGGRFVTLNTNMTSTIVEVDFATSDYGTARQGLLARYVDVNNWLQVHLLKATTGEDFLQINKRVGGSLTVLATLELPPTDVDAWLSMRVAVYSDGMFRVFLGLQGTTVLPEVHRGFDADLVAGGALASGDVGMYDSNIGGSLVRQYDNFAAWVPVADAVMFANQSLEVGPFTVLREDSGGSVWAEPGEFRGRYPRIPPSNVGGTVRVIAKASRGVPGQGPDAGIDNIQVTPHYTPLYLSIPE